MFVMIWVSAATFFEVPSGSFSVARQHEKSLFYPLLPLHDETTNFEEV